MCLSRGPLQAPRWPDLKAPIQSVFPVNGAEARLKSIIHSILLVKDIDLETGMLLNLG